MSSDMETEAPQNLEDGEMWLPSDVLTDADDLLDVAADPDVDDEWASQLNSSGGSSPIAMMEGGNSETSELLDAALLKLKASEINWKHQNGHAGHTHNNSTSLSSSSSSAWNSCSYSSSSACWSSAAPNASWNSYKFTQQKAASVLNAWQQPSKGFQGGYEEKSYIPWVPAMNVRAQAPVENNGQARECGGTGFFLPRRHGKGNESRRKKKPAACSTVFLPYRVVQALNLNIEYLNARTTVRDLYALKESSNGRKNLDNSKQNVWSEQPTQSCSVASTTDVSPTEIGLPQDWTY